MRDPLMLTLPASVRPELLTTAQELAAQFAPRAAEHDRSGEFPHANIDALRAAGYLALTVPKALGGAGASLLETVLCQEALGRGDGPTALVVDMPLHIIGGIAESNAWPADAFARVCQAVVAEGALINSAASEREMGSPSRGGTFATVARQTPSGWRISGRKIYTSGAPALTHALISAALDTGAGPGSTSGVFLVRTDLDGVHVEPTWQGTGMRAARNDDLVLNDVLVAPDDLLLRREPNAPDPTQGSGSTWFQLTIAGLYLGIAEAALAATVEFARNRRPTALGGQAISELESIQRQLGEIEARLLQARALVYQIAQAWDAQPGQRGMLKPYVAHAKANATSQAVDVVERCMVVVGGASMQPDLPLERLSRDVRAGLFHPPTLDASLVGLGRALGQ